MQPALPQRARPLLSLLTGRRLLPARHRAPRIVAAEQRRRFSLRPAPHSPLPLEQKHRGLRAAPPGLRAQPSGAPVTAFAYTPTDSFVRPCHLATQLSSGSHKAIMPVNSWVVSSP